MPTSKDYMRMKNLIDNPSRSLSVANSITNPLKAMDRWIAACILYYGKDAPYVMYDQIKENNIEVFPEFYNRAIQLGVGKSIIGSKLLSAAQSDPEYLWKSEYEIKQSKSGKEVKVPGRFPLRNNKERMKALKELLT